MAATSQFINDKSSRTLVKYTNDGTTESAVIKLSSRSLKGAELTLTLTGISGTFVVEENITNSGNDATGNIISISGSDLLISVTTPILSDATGIEQFTGTPVITGVSSGATGTISAIASTNPQILQINRILWTTDSTLSILWDGTIDVLSLILPSNTTGEWNLEQIGPMPSNATGGLGDILFTDTTGTYTVILELKKGSGYTNL